MRGRSSFCLSERNKKEKRGFSLLQHEWNRLTSVRFAPHSSAPSFLSPRARKELPSLERRETINEAEVVEREKDPVSASASQAGEGKRCLTHPDCSFLTRLLSEERERERR